MATQTGIVTYTTDVLFKADTIMAQQVGDEVQLLNILSPGVTHIARTASTEVPDNIYTIRKTNDATKTFWASIVSNLLKGNVAVAMPALVDNAEHEVTVTGVTGATVGKAYEIGVISGLPAGVRLTMQPVVTANTVKFLITNNTGATLTAGSILTNIYSIK